MGGGYTSRDTEYGATRKAARTHSAFYGSNSHSTHAEEKLLKSSADSRCSPKRNISTAAKNPIAIGIDVTGSVGQGAFVAWDKVPMVFGQLLMQKYIEDPQISYFAVGDRRSDEAPLQVCDFASGDDLDEWVERIWVEGRGGGNSMESYELAAFYYLKRAELLNTEKAFLFLVGDEKPYPSLTKTAAKEVLDLTTEGMKTGPLMKQLMKKFEVCFIQFPYCGYGRQTETAAFRQRWESYLGKERVLYLEDPKGVMDVILGATALLNQSRTLDGYIADLNGENGIREEAQTPERIAAVTKALTPLWEKIQKRDPSSKKPLKGRAAKVMEAAAKKATKK